MGEGKPRLVYASYSHQRNNSKIAVIMLLCLICPVFQPVSADAGLSSTDFGILDAMSDIYEIQQSSNSNEEAIEQANLKLSQVDAAARVVEAGDAIVDSANYLEDVSLRDTSPFEANHPIPYYYLTDPNTQPEGWPANLVNTLFSLEEWEITDPLAIGINTYALYLNFTTKNGGFSYESWDKGTFTGDLDLSGEFNLAENRVDIDGDGIDDVAVALTLQSLGERGQGWDIVTGGSILGAIDHIWVKPTFQWRVDALDLNDPLWDDMASLEVTLMKGFAFDFTLQESESYAMVLDTRFTQPPYEFRAGVGIERIEFSVADSVSTVFELIAGLFGGDLPTDALTLTTISAPFTISLQNPDADSSNLQSDCSDSEWYDPVANHSAESREHRCGYGVGLGYVHFDKPDSQGNIPVLEMGYVDIGIHPVAGSTKLPNELDLTLRNDNVGQNSYDTIELFTDEDADIAIHYYEDRSNVPEGSSPWGNITDSRGWIRGLPSGSMEEDEINAIFTTIGEQPSSVSFAGNVPDRLGFIVAIKNFTADSTPNVNDASLPVNPADPPNTLILIAGVGRIESINYASTFMRGGYANDSSSLYLEIQNLPEVVVIQGSFLLPTTGLSRVNFDNPELGGLTQILDNTLLSIVEIILDIGNILNGIPKAAVATAGSSGGTIQIDCYSQVRITLASGQARVDREVGLISAALASSTQPWIPTIDHILLAQDENIETVFGRGGEVPPLVPVAMSVRIEGIHHAKHSFDVDSSTRIMTIEGQSQNELLIGHINHNGPDLSSGSGQAAVISNRPDILSLTQTPDSMVYDASDPIGTITYGGVDGIQRNAMRLVGLPSEFSLILGEEVGYMANEPLQKIEIQISNASEPLTMDGDHMRFFVDETTGESSLSMEISNVTRARRLSPIEPGAIGPEGNSRLELVRSSSAVFNILIEDESQYDDSFLGMNGRIHINPLPANITIAVPSETDSSGLELPDFGDQEGVEGLSFFLSGLVNFGDGVNGFIHEMTMNLAGNTEQSDEDIAFEMDLFTGESFDVVLDITKGATDAEPDWRHGVSMDVLEQSSPVFNFSRIPKFTASNREVVFDALEDGIIDYYESSSVLGAMLAAELNQTASEQLIKALDDGRIDDQEAEELDLDQWEEWGVTFDGKRAWHARVWLPSLPSGQISMSYDYRVIADVPTYEVSLEMNDWQPDIEDLEFVVNGFNGQNLDVIFSGLDTSKMNDVRATALFSQDTNLTIPRLNLEMRYDMGIRLDYAQARFVDTNLKTRADVFLMGVPQQTDFTATIGDILLLDVFVPEQYRVNGHSADYLMVQQAIFADGKWWPATVFMRDLPAEMHLATEPNTNFDIRQDTTFQGLLTMDYTSNTEDMDMYVEASGRAIDSKGDVVMMAENLPRTFRVSPTDDWGVEIASSGKGVESLYIKFSNSPSAPGVTMKSAEIIGENLRGATVHITWIAGNYPIFVISDITQGRIVATANAMIETEYYGPIALDVDGRGVLLDAQFTGIIPTASSIGVNGIVTDLSLVGSLTGGQVETRHILFADPISSAAISLLGLVV
ncbi:MAG: hypothetical protein CMB73_04055 [Euryarchaeota archaeon]|nr:hypothetical protein [Euryarchaeota archaeon]|tara:strand:+ start:1467 stop:6131 length:4665 start_codon:yes stop_codon:yes gene_type:complete